MGEVREVLIKRQHILSSDKGTAGLFLLLRLTA
jgi:hypothetical protein